MSNTNQKLQQLKAFMTDGEIWTVENLGGEVDQKKLDEIIKGFANLKFILCSPKCNGKPKSLDSILSEMEKCSNFQDGD